MSRVANKPITVPTGVEVLIAGQAIDIKGAKGSLQLNVHARVGVELVEGELRVAALDTSQDGNAQAGTTRALLNNMVIGVSAGYQRKLEILGVGYRAAAKGNVVNLSLGFSHPVEFQVPEGITVETPTQTEVLIKGIDKRLVGQVAADIRGYRPPEPYKGKGVRYSGEQIRRKEAKKT